MAFITNDILVEGSISGSTFFSGGTDFNTIFDSINSKNLTGGTFNSNTRILTLTNSTGGTFTVTGFTDSDTDSFVTGGTYSSGTLVLVNSTGGTFNITGFTSGDTFTTAFTYSNNTFTINRNGGLPALTASINSVTGLTSSGAISSTSLTATSVSSSTITVSGVTFNKLLKEKSGVAAGASFAGNPKLFTVTFATPFSSANYSIQITGPVARSWTYQTQTASGFVINSNVNGAFVGNVYWFAKEYGEV